MRVETKGRLFFCMRRTSLARPSLPCSHRTLVAMTSRLCAALDLARQLAYPPLRPSGSNAAITMDGCEWLAGWLAGCLAGWLTNLAHTMTGFVHTTVVWRPGLDISGPAHARMAATEADPQLRRRLPDHPICQSRRLLLRAQPPHRCERRLRIRLMSHFVLKMITFTKTGSGETQGRKALQKERCILCRARRLRDVCRALERS